jgi:hypothetical protein
MDFFVLLPLFAFFVSLFCLMMRSKNTEHLFIANLPNKQQFFLLARFAFFVTFLPYNA